MAKELNDIMKTLRLEATQELAVNRASWRELPLGFLRTLGVAELSNSFCQITGKVCRYVPL